MTDMELAKYIAKKVHIANKVEDHWNVWKLEDYSLPLSTTLYNLDTIKVDALGSVEHNFIRLEASEAGLIVFHECYELEFGIRIFKRRPRYVKSAVGTWEAYELRV